jgi:acetoin utilization deacetylase AcuC-like enzyme
MDKYARLRNEVDKLSGIQLLEPLAATDTQLLYAHSPAYVQAVLYGTLTPQEQREIGFPWSEPMVERSRRSVGATIAACQAACTEGVAVNLAGGTHHSYRDKGSGFCVFNDAVIAARVLQKNHDAIHRVLIIDLDVHQGNGTASILQNDASIFTFSMHGEKNFPFRKESSDLDVPLPDGCDDATYLNALDHALDHIDLVFKPDFIIYLAGADPHEGDRLGRMRLTQEGLLRRDQLALEFAAQHQAPIAIAMAGGYGKNIDSTVAVHLQTIRSALAMQPALQNALN